jgi:hypothetical protein
MIIGRENTLAENVTAAKIAPTSHHHGCTGPDEEYDQQDECEYRFVADMPFESGPQTTREHRVLAAFQLCTDGIKADAGQRCDKDEPAYHREHDPLAAAEPGEQGHDADQDGDREAVNEALLRRLDQVGYAAPDPAKRRPRRKLLAGRNKGHVFAVDAGGVPIAHY